MLTGDPWLIDVRISGEWRSRPGFEASAANARDRADAVHHWLPARVRNAVTGACFVREPGRGWVEGDQVPAPQPLAGLPAAQPANPRTPMRHPAHASRPAVGPEGIPDDQLQWWQKD